MLNELHAVPWQQFQQPSWNGGDEVPGALRHLAAAASEAESGEACHRMLYALGNDHAGTYFPVVVPAIPYLVDVAVHGQQWAGHAALVYSCLTGSLQIRSPVRKT